MNQNTKTLGLTDVIPQDFQEKSRAVTVISQVQTFPGISDPIHYRLLKRLADILISLLAILFLSPIILVVALIVKFQDKGPVLYSQFRVGKLGHTFRFYKFRSMRVDADEIRQTLLHLSDSDGAAFKMKEDPRRTKFGSVMRKYSLDELPQLLSVLIGHMSIIGPRPHLPHEVETYTQQQLIRLSVKPGLICLREVKGRSKLSFEQWLELDLEYVETRGLLTDLRIFLLSIPAVLSTEGAY